MATAETDLEFCSGGVSPSAVVAVHGAGLAGILGPIIWNIEEVTKAQKIGSVDNLHHSTKSMYLFNKAKDYRVTPGHKIGIVVFHFWDIPKEDAMYTGADAD
jgi:hypothetical protein